MGAPGARLHALVETASPSSRLCLVRAAHAVPPSLRDTVV